MRGARGLRELLARPGIVVAPGAYDAVSARLVERAGFEAVYVGSYATAAARLGLPDAGLVSLREMADHAAASPAIPPPTTTIRLTGRAPRGAGGRPGRSARAAPRA